MTKFFNFPHLGQNSESSPDLLLFGFYRLIWAKMIMMQNCLGCGQRDGDHGVYVDVEGNDDDDAGDDDDDDDDDWDGIRCGGKAVRLRGQPVRADSNMTMMIIIKLALFKKHIQMVPRSGPNMVMIFNPGVDMDFTVPNSDQNIGDYSDNICIQSKTQKLILKWSN